jgi:hypothetical protein
MMIPIQALNRISLKSIIASVFSWLVCQGVAVWHPPTPPENSGGLPLKSPQKATRLCHQKGIDGGMFFLPLRWTERIGSCRANAMVVPTF